MYPAKFSGSILKDIESIEQVHLRLAYLNSSVSVPFEQWHKATFNTETK
jgi:hypothetical protein